MTLELVTPLWKLTPSAVTLRIRMPVNTRLVHRAVHPGADLGVLDPDPVDGGVAQRAADAVDLGAVVALLDVAEDGEVGQVHVGARRWARSCRRSRARHR